MSTPVYISTISMFAFVIVAVFGLRYRASVLQSRARLAGDDAYRQLSTTAVQAQADTAAALAAVNKTLADVQARLASVETMLKAVE